MNKEQVSDDWLVNLYREGNQEAIDCLFERYNVYIYGFIHNLFRKKMICCDYNEIFQEVMIIFLNCIDRYDEENGKFYFYVRLCIERKLYDFLNKMGKEKFISLDDFYYENGTESILDYVAEVNQCPYYETELYNIIKGNLSSEELKIIDMKIEGYTYEEISNEIGIGKQTVYRKINVIKNVIKDILEKID